MKREVTDVKVSPMNEKRWCVDLKCGHHIWVTAKKKPTAKKYECPECTEDESFDGDPT